MKTLLLTGARGLVGDGILRYFHAAGWRIIVACSGPVRSTVDRIDVVRFDLAAVTGKELEAVIGNCDAIVHCAAVMPSTVRPDTQAGARELYVGNTQGTYDLMSLAAKHKIESFVFISGTNILDRRQEVLSEDMPPCPTDSYLLSKLAGEAIADMFNRTSQTRYCSLRISAPYGARFTVKAVIPTFVTRALAGDPLELMGSGQRQQVFTYVGDIARACMSAIDCRASGIYNVAGAQSITMIELAKTVAEAVDPRVKVRFTGQPDPNENAKRRILLDRSKRDLGWEPVYHLERGIACMVEEMRSPLKSLLVPAS